MTQPSETTSVHELADARRSIRKYLPDPISKEEVLEILRRVGRAPSSQNTQPWRFIAVMDPVMREKLSEAAYNQSQVKEAPVVLVLYSDMKDSIERVEEWIPPAIQGDERAARRERILQTFGKMPPEALGGFGKNQAFIALGYLMLVLEELGYGSSPMGGFEPEKVKALFELPPHAEVAALISFGRPANTGYESYRLDPSTLVRFV